MRTTYRLRRGGMGRHTLYVSVGNIASQVALAVLFLLIGRWREPHAFGVAVAIYSVAIISSDVVDFGTTPRTIRDLAAKRLQSEQFSQLLSTRVWLTGFAVMLWSLAGLLTHLSLQVALAMSIFVAVRASEVAVFGVLQGSNQFAVTSSYQVVDRVIALALGATLAWRGVDAAICIAVGLSVGGLVATFLALRHVRLDIARPRFGLRPRYRDYWRFGRSFAASGIVTDLQVLDTAIVAAVGGPVAAGYFAVGARLTGPFTVLASSFSAALVPPVAAAAANGGSLRPFLRRAAAVALVSTFALTLVILFAHPLVLLTFGEDYAPSVPVVQIYALAAIVICASQPIAALLQSSGHARAVALILAPGVLLGLGLIAAGVASNGAVGAAWGFFVSVVFMFLLLLRQVRTHWQVNGDPRAPQL